jgi:ssDNA-binding Zn-finger/Zn-ribbon topoisomerase 1
MKLTSQQKEYLASKSPTLFLEHYKIKNEKGDPISFQHHLFQYDLYEDYSPFQSWQKPAQVGASSIAVNKILHLAKYKGVDIIYTLPTDKDRNDFVSSKVNRFITQNPIYSSWTKDKDSVEQKAVGDSQIYFRGTFAKKAALMIPSDVNVYDEVDASDQDVVDEYSTRLQHSKYGWEWFFSHPSVDGYGVNRSFLNSDQKHWFIRCSRCNKEQYMNWPESVDIEKGIYVCKFCHKEMRESDRRKGRWVQKFKGKEVSGYQITSLFCPWISAPKILKYYKEKSEEYFYNKVLGLPYVGRDNVVSETIVLQNCVDTPNDRKERIVIGCDTGLTQYYVMGTKNGIFHYGSNKGYDEIEMMMKQYPNAIMVMDAKGDLVKPRELQEKYPGRVFLCDYRQDRKSLQLVRWGTGKESGSVLADRNRMIQFVVEELKKNGLPLNGLREEWLDYARHWGNIYRTEEMDSLGMPKRVWERKGGDHWVHATVYWRVGISKYAAQATVLDAPENDLPIDMAYEEGKTTYNQLLKDWTLK